MLTLRNEQLDAFRRDEWRPFLRSIAAVARKTLASQGDPRAGQSFETAVADAVELAQKHGFRARPDLARFARFVVITGPGWDTPAARAILADETLTAEARLDRLEAVAKG